LHFSKGHVQPEYPQNRCGVSSSVLVYALLYHAEQMIGICRLLPLFILVVQAVLSYSHSYQNGMHVLTKMGGGKKNGEDSK